MDTAPGDHGRKTAPPLGSPGSGTARSRHRTPGRMGGMMRRPPGSNRRGVYAFAFTFGLIAILASAFFSVSMSGGQETGSSAVAFALLGFLGLIVTLARVEVGVALLALCTAVSPEFTLGGIPNLRLEDFLTPVLFFSWAARVVRYDLPLRPANLKVPVILYLFVSLISSLRATVFMGLNPLVSGLFYFKTLQYFLIFVLVLNAARSRRIVEALIWVIPIAGCLGGLIGIFEYFTDLAPTYLHSAGDIEGLPRLGGPLGEADNIYSAFLLFTLLASYGVVLTRPSPAKRIVLVLTTLLIGFPLLFTVSRAAFVSVLVGLALMGLLEHRRLLFLMPLGVILVALFLPEDVVARYGSVVGVLQGTPPPSWQEKVRMWNYAMERIAENPLLGGGVGSIGLGGLDNEYIRQVNDLGIIGGILFLAILWKILGTSLATFRRARHDLFRGYALGFTAAFAAFCVNAISATTFTAIRSAEIFFFAAGLLYACHHIQGQEPPPPEEEDEPRPAWASRAEVPVRP